MLHDLIYWFGQQPMPDYGGAGRNMGIPGMARGGSCQHYPHDVPGIQAPRHNGTPLQVAHVVAVVSGYDWRPKV